MTKWERRQNYNQHNPGSGKYYFYLKIDERTTIWVTPTNEKTAGYVVERTIDDIGEVLAQCKTAVEARRWVEERLPRTGEVLA